MLKYTITDLFIEYAGKKTTIPLNSGAVAFIPARQITSHEFDVDGPKTVSTPITFAVAFSLIYDNIPSIRDRRMRRVIEFKFMSFRPMKWSSAIRDQEES